MKRLFRSPTSGSAELASGQLASGRRPPPMLDRGGGLRDFQRDAAARIVPARQGQAPGKRHGLAIDLEMGGLVVLKKSNHELRSVSTAITLEARLRRGRQ